MVMLENVRKGIIGPNNSPAAARGLVTSTLLGPDLCHLHTVGRTVRIRKILWYNATGAARNLIFGTVTNIIPVAPGTFVPLLPPIVAVNGVHDMITEAELPDVEFIPDRTAGAGGLTGDIYLMAGVAGVLVRLEVEEY